MDRVEIYELVCKTCDKRLCYQNDDGHMVTNGYYLFNGECYFSNCWQKSQGTFPPLDGDQTTETV